MKLDLLPCLARDQKSPPQRRIIANIFPKEVDLHWRKVCSTNSVFIIRSKKIHSRIHRTTLYHEGLKCQQKFAQSCLQEGELSAKIDDVPRVASIFNRLFWNRVCK